MRKLFIRSLVVGALVFTAFAVSPPPRAEAANFTKLTLINGWKNYGTRPAAVANDNGIIRFRGSIHTSEQDNDPFTLPAAFRPSGKVVLTLSVCNGAAGRLTITPEGQASLGASPFSNAQCFVSLEGVSFVKTTTGATPLPTLNGWQVGLTGQRAAGAKLVNGVVNLVGHIGNGESEIALKLPEGMRPNKTVFLPIDVCAGVHSRVGIDPDGSLYVLPNQVESACGTSLEGLSFLKNTNGATSLPTTNGWTGFSEVSNRLAFAKTSNGVVHLTGTLKRTSGASMTPFVLPEAFRPSKTVFVNVEMSVGSNGRVIIDPNGTVILDAENHEQHAATLTSLEGVTYSL